MFLITEPSLQLHVFDTDVWPFPCLVFFMCCCFRTGSVAYLRLTLSSFYSWPWPWTLLLSTCLFDSLFLSPKCRDYITTPGFILPPWDLMEPAAWHTHFLSTQISLVTILFIICCRRPGRNESHGLLPAWMDRASSSAESLWVSSHNLGLEDGFCIPILSQPGLVQWP